MIAARFRIYTGGAGAAITGGAQTISFYDVDNTVTSLENKTTLFSQLGTGDVLASQVYTEADDNGGFKDIQLNAVLRAVDHQWRPGLHH